jgi:hypothetical protein
MMLFFPSLYKSNKTDSEFRNLQGKTHEPQYIPEHVALPAKLDWMAASEFTLDAAI